MKVYQDKISSLTKDLEAQRRANDEKIESQNRAFDSLNQLEAEKAKLGDEVDALKQKLEEIEAENANLHTVAQEGSTVLEEKLQLASTLAQLQAENESLVQENEYYKNDLIPTMREKSNQMQKKFNEFSAERQALREEVDGLRSAVSDSK